MNDTKLFDNCITINYQKPLKKRFLKSKVLFNDNFSLSFKYYLGNDQGYPSGAISMICGDNGAGKTTLLRAIDPSYPASFGCNVNYCCTEGGTELNYFDDYSKLLQSCIAVYPTLKENHLKEDFTLEETLIIFDSIKLNYDKKYLCQLLKEYDLIKKCKLSHYSHGEQVLIALFIALSRKPSVLLLDEVFSFLSISNRKKVSVLLNEYVNLPKTRSIIYTSNHPDEDVNLLFPDFCILMDKFQIIEMMQSEDLHSSRGALSESIAKAIEDYRTLIKKY